MNNPKVKAWVATTAFVLAGIVATLFYSVVSPFFLPHLIIYTVLVINTFFSIRFWGVLQPDDFRQRTIDTILVVAYFVLAFSIGEPLSFAVAALFLFSMASVKYVLMRNRTSHAALVRRKTFLDAFGAVACMILLGATFTVYALEAAWLFAIGFSLANIYLLLIRPMYRL